MYLRKEGNGRVERRSNIKAINLLVAASERAYKSVYERERERCVKFGVWRDKRKGQGERGLKLYHNCSSKRVFLVTEKNTNSTQKRGKWKTVEARERD